MLTRADAVALLKVLVAASWADSQLKQAEMNYIKALAQRFRLSDADWLELEPHLEDPPTEEETRGLFGDLLSRIGTSVRRAEVIDHLEVILKADAQMTAEEHDFLEQYTAILNGASTVELLAGRIKTLFRRRPRTEALDLDEFIRNKILFKLRRRLDPDQITAEIKRACLVGGLMGIVARADGEIDGRELDEIRRRLEGAARFSSEVLDVLMTVVDEESVRGLDRARVVSELNQNITFDEKIELLDLLFAVASTDGSLTSAELEELRGISSALNLSHRQYIDAKVRTRRG